MIKIGVFKIVIDGCNVSYFLSGVVGTLLLFSSIGLVDINIFLILGIYLLIKFIGYSYKNELIRYINSLELFFNTTEQLSNLRKLQKEWEEKNSD